MASVSTFLSRQIPCEFILRSAILEYINFHRVQTADLLVTTHFPLTASNMLPAGHSIYVVEPDRHRIQNIVLPPYTKIYILKSWYQIAGL